MTVNRSYVGYRLAQTRMGDTIQKVAARELGQAGRWPELVAYNGLAPPYLVDSLSGLEESSDGGQVLLTGGYVKIPAARPPNQVSDPRDIFGTDVLLDRDGQLTANENGDLEVIRDVANLTQALNIRLATHVKELVWHPTYGNPLHDLVGRANDEVNLLLSEALASRTLRSDPRIDRIERITTEANGDVIHVDAITITVDGRPLPVNTEDV
jgi:phage baseplate assembly protein W